jgi:hypothetical protein
LESGVIRWVTDPAIANTLPDGLLGRVQSAADSIIAGTLIVAGQGSQ